MKIVLILDVGRIALAIVMLLHLMPMSGTDRLIRVMVAIVLGYLYFSGTVTGTLGLILAIIGGVFILTSLVGFCPLYTLLGLNTCHTKKA